MQIGTIERPVMRLNQGEIVWDLTAEMATVTADKEHVQLLGQVHVERHEPASGHRMQVDTREVQIEVTPQLATTDQAVNMSDGNTREPASQQEQRLGGGVLVGVPAFVRRDGDRGQGLAVEFVGRETHSARNRIVVVTEIADFDTDFLQVVAIEQVARQFGTISREVVFRDTIVTLQHVLHPQLGSIHQHQQHTECDQVNHWRIA